MAIIDSDGTRELPDSDVQNYLEAWNQKSAKNHTAIEQAPCTSIEQNLYTQ